MSKSVKLSAELVRQAREHSEIYHRSVPKQIEYWSRIGKVAEENPDLPYNLIKDIILAQKEVANGQVTPYEFG